MKRETIMNLYKMFLIKLLEENNFNKLGRKLKFSNEFYLNCIFRILFYGESWNTFKCDECDRSTIRKRFYKWRDLGIFKMTYEELFKRYCEKRCFKNLFIDSTIIENSNCGELVGTYYKIKTKKQLKVSVICDSNKVPLSYTITKPSVHDVKQINPLIKQLKINLKRNTKLIGDKGYIARKKYYSRRNIRLISPKRKNQKTKTNKKHKGLLKLRFVVEKLFSDLKRTYKRLKLVCERKLDNFVCFLLMAFSCQIIRADHNIL